MNREVPKCDICGHNTHEWITKRNGKSIYSIYRCSKCGHAEVMPKFDARDIKEIYNVGSHEEVTQWRADVALNKSLKAESDEGNSIPDARRIAEEIRKLGISDLEGAASPLLDVGCGYGFIIKEGIKNGFECTGVEPSPLSRAVCRQYTGLEIKYESFEELPENKNYDIIVMSHVLEHACSPREWIRKSSRLLNNRGILYICVPNHSSFLSFIMRSNYPFIIPPYHLSFFTRRSIRKMLEDEGFNVERTFTTTRIPSKTISRILERRLKIKRLWGFQACIGIATRIIDSLGKGNFVHIYARKA